MMRTSVVIDDTLMENALKSGKLSDKTHGDRTGFAASDSGQFPEQNLFFKGKDPPGGRRGINFDAALYCNALTKASGSVDTVYVYTTPDSFDTDYSKGGFRACLPVNK